jgi:hypothetical protein
MRRCVGAEEEEEGGMRIAFITSAAIRLPVYCGRLDDGDSRDTTGSVGGG